MNRITEKLFLSDCIVANNEHLLRHHNINAVLNVCNQQDELQLDGVSFTHYPMNDDATTTEEQLFYAVKTLDLLMNEGHERVLVHCLAGVSRSAMVVILHLAWRNNLNFSDALKRVKKERPEVNPNAWFLSIGPKVLERLNAEPV